MTLIVGLSSLAIECTSGNEVRRLEPPRRFQCAWTPETLTLKGWRGKVAVRTYRFMSDNGMEYSVKGAAYRLCHALPSPPASKELKQARKTNTTLWWFFFALFIFWIMTGFEGEESEVPQKRRMHFLREYEAEERRRRDKARREEVKRVEAEREKSRIGLQKRLERKAKRRAELEARTKANAERRKRKQKNSESCHK